MPSPESVLSSQIWEPTAQQFGVPEQLLTDMGMEWKLVAFACQLLALRAGWQPWERAAHRLFKSTRNVCAPPWAGLAAHAPPVARGAPRAFHPTDPWPTLQ